MLFTESQFDSIGVDKITPLVLPLKTLGHDDVKLAGGKGANLGELMRAGFPVPDGFVVTTAAYDYFLSRNKLEKTLSQGNDNRGGSAIRTAIEGATIPEDLRQMVLTAYRDLGKGSVAVRSSATAEDLPGESFAGQQDTFLNINGDNELVESVKRCWASLWSERAIVYRARISTNHKRVKMAVVVQRMVAAEVAGVLFTVNPVTGARDETVIDAHPGQSEMVVGGTSTPDHFVLRRRLWSWTIVFKRQGKHQDISVPGTNDQKVTAHKTVKMLDDNELKKLATLGKAIASHFGSPQDIEWVRDGSRLHILQTRPMTAVPEPPLHLGWIQRIANGILAEFVPERPYPLEITTWTPVPIAALSSMFRPLGLQLPRFEDLFMIEDSVVIRYRGRVNLRITPGILIAPCRVQWLAWRYDCLRWRNDPLLAKAISVPAELARHDVKKLDWPGLIKVVKESTSIISPCLGELRRRYVPRAILSTLRLRLELKLLGLGRHFSAIMSGVENKTLESNRFLEDLAAMVRNDSYLTNIFTNNDPKELRAILENLPEKRDFRAKFDTFLSCYGHRETGSLLLIYRPTWKESPEIVLSIIKELAQTDPTPREEPPAWEKARGEVLHHPMLRLPPFRHRFLRLLQEARCFTAIREDTRFYAALPLPVIRQAFLEMGRRLSKIGIVDTPEEIFHLTMSELESIGSLWPPSGELAEKLRTSARKRKNLRATLEETPLMDPRLLRQVKHEGDALVSGSPAGEGVVEGPVRIIRQISEFSRLRQGEILVAPYTSPAWTPLFQRAAAVVVDTGGITSHAAIVAREYGIPAIMGTTDGTRRLRDGQRVRVDGSQGKVFDAEAG